jgi:hypothetical protein
MEEGDSKLSAEAVGFVVVGYRGADDQGGKSFRSLRHPN